MTVLAIIGALVALGLIIWFIKYSNEYSWSEYGYEIFNFEEFVGYVIGYGLLYFGYDWFKTAMQHQGDILNGILLMIIGGVILLAMVLNSIAHTSWRYGLLMSLVKGVLYALATPIVIIGILMVGAWLMETKPVIRLDDD